MAGIAGLFVKRPAEESSRILTKMGQVLSQRGKEQVLTCNLQGNAVAIVSVRSLKEDSITVKHDLGGLQIRSGFECESNDAILTGCLHLDFNQEGIVIRRFPYSMKPLYYGRNNMHLAFASERKALWSIGINDPTSLQPGEMVSVNEGARWQLTEFADISPPPIQTGISPDEMIQNLSEVLRGSFDRIRNKRVGVLFSGGVDSSLVALMAQEVCDNIILYSASSMSFHDRIAAKTSADSLGIAVTTIDLNPDDIWDILPNLLFAIESANLMDVEIALPFYLASRQAASEGITLMVSGQGPDELFAGYARHVKIFKDGGEEALNRQLWEEVSVTHRSNIERDDRAIAAHGMTSFFPYLSAEFITLALEVPAKWKIAPGAEPERKVLFRDLAQHLGLPETISLSPKKATQYSSGSSRMLMRSLVQNVDELKGVPRRKLRARAQKCLNRIASDVGIPVDIDPS